jgi:hypothetical protein
LDSVRHGASLSAGPAGPPSWLGLARSVGVAGKIGVLVPETRIGLPLVAGTIEFQESHPSFSDLGQRKSNWAHNLLK